MSKKIKGLKKYLLKMRDSIWLFPVVLFFILCSLSAARINGSSVGIYFSILNGSSAKDPDLLFGQPRPIRSDEWGYITQMTIAQAQAGYPRINENINTGRDMSLITDVPYKEWSTLFKPQNLAFFVMPFVFAFAFRWWLLLYLLIVSCYFLILRLLPGKKLFGILASTGLALSPFIFWWYQTATLAPLFYAFFILIICIRIIRKETIPVIRNSAVSQAIQMFILAYLFTAFTLVLYPPFQIPVIIVSAVFIAGFILNERREQENTIQALAWIAGACLIAATICGVFVATRSEPISRIANTVYPGSRVIKSGGLNPIYIFDSFTMPALQSGVRASKFFQNQSEASNFLLLVPFFIIPTFAILWIGYRQTKQINFLLLGMQFVCLMLIARMFLPFGDPVYKILLLHKVPHERLVIGLGFAGFLHLIVLYAYSIKIKVSRKTLLCFAALYGTICWIILLVISHNINITYPGYISSKIIWIALPTIFASMIYLILLRRWLFFVFIFVGFSFLSVFTVNPIYRGLGPLSNNAILQRMKQVSKPDDTWAVADDLVYENFPMLVNRKSVTGNQIYPDINFWRAVEGIDKDYVYNRYAHSVFNSNADAQDLLRLSSPDTFQVKLTCSPFVKKEVDYILIPRLLTLPCVREVDRVVYPDVLLLIYKVTP